MSTRTNRIAAVAAATFALTFATAGAAGAHSQTVQPPSKDSPTVSGPISNAWAQAHCHAASPGIVGEASNGVMTFSPAGALPCPPIPNPGGQVHPGSN
jgi:hypothetical protein